MIGRNWLGQWKSRRAERALALDPTPEAYAALARDLATGGWNEESARVAAEGFARFPTAGELRSLFVSARTLELERRRRRGRGDEAAAARAELVNLHLVSGDLRAAAALAEEGTAETPDDPLARLALARVKLARFAAAHAATDGLEALALLEGIANACGAGPVRLLAEFATEVGAWRAAHLYAARWRALAPDDPAATRLQARLAAHRAETSPDLPSAIRRASGTPATAPPAPVDGTASLPRLGPLFETVGVQRAVHADVPTGVAADARPRQTPDRWGKALAEIGHRTIVRLGLGEPEGFCVGGNALAVAVGFGTAGAVIAECRGFEEARRAQSRVCEAAAGGGAR